MKRRSFNASVPSHRLRRSTSVRSVGSPFVRVLVTLLCAAALLAAAGCVFVRPGVALRVILPAGGSPWEREGSPVTWTVKYPAVGGGVESRVIPAGEGEADIVAARGTNVPVAAYPLGRLKPAGGFAVHTAEGREWITGRRELDLNWEDGAAAELFLESLGSPERIDRVDGSYLSSLLVLEGEGNPWSCDIDRIRSSILFRSLWKMHISRMEVYEIEYVLPAGEWVCELPLFAGRVSSTPLPSAEGGEPAEESEHRVTFTGLYPGLHRFFSSAGSEDELELHILVEKNGEHRFICGPPRVFNN
ncbi:MAG: hypothetical protein ACLFNZ_00660 [Spirochaetaceae bacterium]